MSQQERLRIKTNHRQEKAVRIFTDREDLREAFWKQYRQKQADIQSGEDYVNVLHYYGFGGIGKSSLLKKLMAEMDERLSAPHYVSYDFVNAVDVRTVLTTLKSQFTAKYQYEFPLFDIGLYIYCQKCGEKVAALERDKILDSSDLLKVSFSIADNIPGISVAAKILSTIDQVAAFARTKVYLKKHEVTIHRLEHMDRAEVYKMLPELFAQDLERNLEEATEPLVIFLDTYELLVNEMSAVGMPLLADLWLRGDDGPVMRLPKTLWVIAGREKLKWETLNDQWETAIDAHILGDLSEQDSISFLRSAGVADETLRKQLYKLTNGTPVYLDLCVECFEKMSSSGESVDISQFGHDTSELIERFVRYMDDAQKDLVYMVACLDKWNDELFSVVCGALFKESPYTAYEKLKEYSFVKPLENGYYSIHQTVGKVLTDKCIAPIKQGVANALLEYAEKRLAQSEVLSTAYTQALTYMVRAALLLQQSRDDLYRFFRERLEEPILDAIEAGQFEEVNQLLEMLSQVSIEAHNDLLYAKLTEIKSFYYIGTGDYQKAEVCINTAWEIFRKHLGEEDPQTLDVQASVAEITNCLGRCLEAEKLFRDALEKQRKKPEENRSELRITMNNFAKLLLRLERYDEALALVQDSLASVKAEKGEDDPDALTIMNNLAVVLSNMGNNEKALAIYEELLEKKKRKLGEKHLSTVVTMGNLASTLSDMGRNEEALALYEQTLEAEKEILGENNPQTLSTIGNYAVVLADMKRHEEARKLERMLLDKRIMLLGKEHPDTVTAMENLWITLCNLHRYEEAQALKVEYVDTP